MNIKKLVLVPLAALVISTGPGFNQAQADEHEDMPTVETEAVELRTTLDHLLSEHAFLAAEAMKKGADGAEDFDQIVGALDENTAELSETIASVYGEEAGQQFNEMWSSHIGYFVDYVNATAEGDEAGKEEALNQLSQYREDFSMFLETATEERVEAESLAEGLQMHVNQLIGAFDAYTGGDYEMAYDQTREAYQHMFMTSEGLSGAIVTQMPDQFMSEMPEEMPNTAMAPPAESNTLLISIVAGMMLLSAVIIAAKVRKERY